MGYCFVCKALGDSNGLFRLPQKEAKRKNWVDALQKGYTSPLQTSKKDLRVCFRHFRDSDYKLTGTTLRLKPGRESYMAQWLRLDKKGYEIVFLVLINSLLIWLSEL